MAVAAVAGGCEVKVQVQVEQSRWKCPETSGAARGKVACGRLAQQLGRRMRLVTTWWLEEPCGHWGIEPVGSSLDVRWWARRRLGSHAPTRLQSRGSSGFALFGPSAPLAPILPQPAARPRHLRM